MSENRTYRSHYKIGVGGKLEPKKSFETEKEAHKVAMILNTKDNIIHKMVAYKCMQCCKWHVGSNHTVLTDKDKIEYKKKLEKFLLD